MTPCASRVIAPLPLSFIPHPHLLLLLGKQALKLGLGLLPEVIQFTLVARLERGHLFAKGLVDVGARRSMKSRLVMAAGNVLSPPRFARTPRARSLSAVRSERSLSKF